MTVSARQLNRATLERQLLLQREALPVTDAVRRVVALQAQEAVSPYIALWNRVAGFESAALDAALAEQRLLKASLMRVTLHIVHAHDYPTFHEAMQRTLRAARLNDRRFKAAGMPVEEVEALMPEMLAHAAEGRSNAEMEAWLDERVGRVLERPGVWWAVRHVGPFVHAPTDAPWTFGSRPAYRAAPIVERPGDSEASLRTLIRRYLEGFGPATLDDFCKFALLNKSWVKPVVEGMAGELVELDGPGRGPLYDVPGRILPAQDVPAPPRMLAMWDSILLAHADRSRFIPVEYRKLVTRSNGDVLATLLVNGYVAGVWRPVEEGIEATAFRRLSEADWAGLAEEARALIAMLAERDPHPYSRYGRWWAGLPAVEVRVLG